MNKQIYLLVTASFALLQQKIDELIKKHNFSEASITTYDLEEASLARVLEDVDTISFLTPKKVIIAKHCHFLESGTAIEESTLKHLEKYIATPSEDVLFILTVDKLDERKKIVKHLRKNISVIELSPDMTQFIKTALKDYQLEPGVINLLKEYTTNDYERLLHECEKLKLYKLENKKISCDDIKLLVEPPLADKDELSFSFVRSIALRDKKEAFRIYHQMEKLNLECYAIIGLLESQYRLLYQVMVLNNQHLSKDEIAKKLEVHPFRVSKTLELVRQYQLSEVSDFLKQLAKIDYKIKSGAIDATMVLELLILNNV